MTQEQAEKYLAEVRAKLKANFEACHLPGYMWDGVDRWVMDGIHPGGFLTAAFRDELVEAFSRADTTNTAHMKDWANFLYHYVPAPCRRPTGLKKWKGYTAIIGEEVTAGGPTE